MVQKCRLETQTDRADWAESVYCAEVGNNTAEEFASPASFDILLANITGVPVTPFALNEYCDGMLMNGVR